MFESLSTDNMKVRVYGKTAVMAGRLTINGRYKDRDISGQYNYTNVLGKQQQSWRIVASHATDIASVVFGGHVTLINEETAVIELGVSAPKKRVHDDNL